MATIPFPYGVAKATDARLPRADYHPLYLSDAYIAAEHRRALAEVRRCMTALDDAMQQIERRLLDIEKAMP